MTWYNFSMRRLLLRATFRLAQWFLAGTLLIVVQLLGLSVYVSVVGFAIWWTTMLGANGTAQAALALIITFSLLCFARAASTASALDQEQTKLPTSNNVRFTPISRSFRGSCPLTA